MNLAHELIQWLASMTLMSVVDAMRGHWMPVHCNLGVNHTYEFPALFLHHGAYLHSLHRHLHASISYPHDKVLSLLP